jgi:hypothetical protein
MPSKPKKQDQPQFDPLRAVLVKQNKRKTWVVELMNDEQDTWQLDTFDDKQDAIDLAMEIGDFLKFRVYLNGNRI